MIPLYLKKGEERRLRTGHPWVYNNELDVGRARLRGIPPGEPVELRDHRGEPLASAYANPHSLIAARIVSREPGVRLERGLLAARISAADALRRREFADPFYRVVFGESDALPGLVMDRYGDVAVVQITTAGMERVKADLVDLLRSEFAFRTVVLRNDTPARALEGLEASTEVVGDAIGETIMVEEGGGGFEAAPLTGQKTGWYYDHRANRARLASRVAGQRVLDLYSYTGAWGIQCALAGASEVLCIDSSANAIELALRNAARNGVADRVRVERSDAVRALKSLRSAGERFDVVVLDPPSFIRRRKDRIQGLRGVPADERPRPPAPRPGRLPRLGLVLGPPRAREAPRDYRARRLSLRTSSTDRGGRRAGPRPPRAPRITRDQLPPGVLRRVRLSSGADGSRVLRVVSGRGQKA